MELCENTYKRYLIYVNNSKVPFLEPGSIFEPKGYKGTSIIMYVFNWSLSSNIHFILYVGNFRKFIYPRNYLSKTYKIIQFSNVRFRIMYVFQKSVQNASFPCGRHVSYSIFILYVFFNFQKRKSTKTYIIP